MSRPAVLDEAKNEGDGGCERGSSVLSCGHQPTQNGKGGGG